MREGGPAARGSGRPPGCARSPPHTHTHPDPIRPAPQTKPGRGAPGSLSGLVPPLEEPSGQDGARFLFWRHRAAALRLRLGSVAPGSRLPPRLCSAQSGAQALLAGAGALCRGYRRAWGVGRGKSPKVSEAVGTSPRKSGREECW